MHALSSVVVLVTSTAAFFLTVPVFHLATRSHPSPFALILDPALTSSSSAGSPAWRSGCSP